MNAAEFGIAYRDEEWPHGLMCVACPHVFQRDESYCTRLYGFMDDSPLLEAVCLSCATAGTAPLR
ncbi:MAG: hypothetical protein QOJ13_2385 [Gaiellales bacterium]|nr:hypothetical protein [Gaiellales bacterium]